VGCMLGSTPSRAKRVLHPEAKRPRSSLLGEHALEGVEHEGVRAIADGVHAHLEAAGGGLRGDAVELVGRDQDEPRVLGVVAVGMMEGGAAGPERAVGQELEGAHRDQPVAHRLGPEGPVALPGVLVATRHRHVVAEGEFAALHEPAIRRERAQIRAHLMDAGEPTGETGRDGLAHRLVEAGFVGRGLHALHEALRGIHEESGGLAAGVADD
jgi:hypothetical protein